MASCFGTAHCVPLGTVVGVGMGGGWGGAGVGLNSLSPRSLHMGRMGPGRKQKHVSFSYLLNFKIHDATS